MTNFLNLTVSQLISQGILTQEQLTQLINKKRRADERSAKQARKEETKSLVKEALSEILAEPGATVKHRTVWNFLGRSKFTRDEVLNALQSLRDDGVLQNIRTTGNNFHVFWALVEQPVSPGFEVNGN